MNNCKRVVDHFIEGKIKDWKGMPPDCSEEEIKLMYAFNEGEGVVYFGDERIKYTFRVLNRQGFEQGINFCFTEGKLTILFAEFSSFMLQQFQEISNAIGQPSFKTNFYLRDEIIKNGEWVYPAKGITVCIIPETGVLAKIIVYPTCSIESYWEKHYHSQPAKEF